MSIYKKIKNKGEKKIFLFKKTNFFDICFFVFGKSYKICGNIATINEITTKQKKFFIIFNKILKILKLYLLPYMKNVWKK